MLDPEQTWIDEFKKLPPAKTPIEGITNLANVIEKLTNKVEPVVPTGTVTPGIFKWAKAPFVTMMLSQTPTQGIEWAQKIANAWAAGVNAGVITPSLVSDPATWAVSTTDVNTAPGVPVTVPTVAAGQAAIVSLLLTVPAQVKVDATVSPDIFAKAFRAGVSAFTFILIGIAGTPPSPVPLPVTVKAQ